MPATERRCLGLPVAVLLRFLHCGEGRAPEQHFFGKHGTRSRGVGLCIGAPHCPASQVEAFSFIITSPQLVVTTVVWAPFFPAATSPWPNHLRGARCSEGHHVCLTLPLTCFQVNRPGWQPLPHVFRKNTGGHRESLNLLSPCWLPAFVGFTGPDMPL